MAWRPRDLALLNLLWLGLNLQTAALAPLVVPLQALALVTPGALASAEQARFIGLLGALGAVVALIVQPLTGALSDRTHASLGRRRPHIAWGTALAVAGALLAGLAGGPVAFAVGLILLQVGNNATTASFQALLPDLVPHDRRGAASGWLGLMTIVGSAGSLGLGYLLLASARPGSAQAGRGAFLFYVLGAAVLGVIALATIAVIREPAVATQPPRSLRSWLEPWRHPAFARVFAARVFVMLGFTLFMTFIEYYFARVAHVTDFVGATAGVALLALATAVVSAFALGGLSDRWGRVRLAALASAVMAAAAIAFQFLRPGSPLWPLGLLFGLGYGGYMSVDWALAVDALPSRLSAGRDLGIWSLASTVPGIAAPALGGAVVSIWASAGNVTGGYQAVFALAAVLFAAGTVAVLRVPEPRPLPYPSRQAGRV
ncbi:MAG TPA: MFS transporter [Candidatus Dormibacteraeota bacterium]